MLGEVVSTIVHQKVNGTESQRTPKLRLFAMIDTPGLGVRETWVRPLEISWMILFCYTLFEEDVLLSQ